MADKSFDVTNVDLVGLGKLAAAIPPTVYERSTEVLITTFEKLTAPITATTDGLGRYLKQKFDNMVEAEKAIATFTIEKAVARARQVPCKGIESPKTFVKSIEEASRETDPVLHEMWANLITTQLVLGRAHPHFVEVLSHFSPQEAKLLVQLKPPSEIGENGGSFIGGTNGVFAHWTDHARGSLRPWEMACDLLREFQFIEFAAPKHDEPKRTAILYRTSMGDQFLQAVSERK